MNKINFIFVLHFHQPTGQSKWVWERIYENSYKLLLEVFKKHADIKFTVHLSGPLLLYMYEYYQSWLNELFKLGDLGTIEFLAGTIGESILPLLPSEDRVNQVKEYMEFFEKISGFRPRGLWLPERVWETTLPVPLARNGIEYVFVDDSLLHNIGKATDDNTYVWITEEDGYRVKLFFIDTVLRYKLPWAEPSSVLNYMLSRGDTTGEKIIVWGSDAEKFGEWMDPRRSMEWLERFLYLLEENRDNIITIHPSQYLVKYKARGLIYLPPGSYDKMLEWSRGYIKNFLIKYSESNNMHKKMLYVRWKLTQIPQYNSEAWRHYYLAQCNDVYWHGLFGGIYLSSLRQAIYEHYIIAERIAEETINYYGEKKMVIKKQDFDYDDYKEVIVETPNINLYFKPDDGGTLFEYDVKVPGFEHNVQDTMTRYPEPYIDYSSFQPDWYRRVSLRLHLWDTSTSLNDWINNKPFIDKSDLALGRYRAFLNGENIVMRYLGGYYQEGQKIQVFAEKVVKPLNYGYQVDYTIENIGDKSFEALIGYEYHIAPKINRVVKDNRVEYVASGVHSIHEQTVDYSNQVKIVSDNYPDIVLESSRRMEVWISPLHSYARTEKGLQSIFQGIAVMFIDRVKMEPREKREMSVKHYVGVK